MGAVMEFDLTRPNAGRMFDYWLGGNHNFEIDRQLADQVSNTMPIVRQQVAENRDLVKRGVPYLYARGIRAIIDFGAALPTCENTHLIAEQVDPAIKVVYSDIDPITVAYGKELLKGNPIAIYLQCDAAVPEQVLNAPETQRLLGNERRVGIFFLALGHMMPEDRLRQSWQGIYDWVAPGSLMFVSHASENWDTDPELRAVRKLYAASNVPAYYRNPDQLRELAKPWQVTSESIIDHRYWNLVPPREKTRHVGYAMMLFK